MLVWVLIAVVVVYTVVCAYLVLKAEMPDATDMQVNASNPRSVLQNNPLLRFFLGRR